jgi:NTE family protein
MAEAHPPDADAGADAASGDRSARSHGLALCLSGGGYRAALFHLGALRRLNELGILSQVETVSSVSGGSIIAAHLATTVREWPAPGGAIAEWDAVVAEPFRRVAAHDIRTWPVLKRTLFPWNWLRRSVQVNALAAEYFAKLTTLHLVDLPVRPRYVLCATDITHGVNWVFSGDRVGSYRAGHRVPDPAWPLATAVAASSCFPPVFSPLAVSTALARSRGAVGTQTDSRWRSVRLVDGGVYDNMGLEPVWKSHSCVLVSDGGALFGDDRSSLFVRDWFRYMAIQGNQAASLRKRWLISSLAQGEFTGAYWGIGTVASEPGSGQNPYSDELITHGIAPVRTDLNGFSAGEIGVLENHGYAVADEVIGMRTPALIAIKAPFALPNPSWATESAARDALRSSQARFSWAHLLRRGQRPAPRS